jgi:hypothetical protein
MGGWICIFGDGINFNERLKNFRAKFSVEGTQGLKIDVNALSEDFKTIFWGWTNNKIPDFYIHKHLGNSLVLCGVITEFDAVSSILTLDQKVAKLNELWLDHGEKTMSQINGSFSCVFYNERSKKITIYVDRFASRSVWIGKENSVWIVGNYPSAIVSLMERPAKLDPAGLWSFFHAGRQVGNHSLYSNIRALMAGQNAILSPGCDAKISYWWKRKYKPEENLSPREWGFRLAHAIKRSANRYKKVSKKPYLFLSGGLDSRIVAAAFGKPLKTLTICTYPNTESRIASSISKIVGLEHKTIIRSPYWYLENTQASALISSGIYLNHHAHFITPARLVLSEEPDAVFLLGDLMENFNKHYLSLPSHYSLIFSPENIPGIFYSFVPYTVRNYRKRRGKLFNKKIKDLLEEQYLSSLKEYAHSVMEVSENDEDRFDTFLRWSNVGITPTYNMITCIWPFAGERNLYFDNDLDDLSLSVPFYLKGKAIIHKWILFYLNKILLMIPDSNTLLPPVVSKMVANYAKKIRPSLGKIRRSHSGSKKTLTLRTSGSWLLLHEMYRKDKLYRNQIEKLIYSHDVFSPDLFNLDEIMQVWQEYLGGNIEYHFEIEALRSFGALQETIPCNRIDL